LAELGYDKANAARSVADNINSLFSSIYKHTLIFGMRILPIQLRLGSKVQQFVIG
jgi:hypothetical protein